MFILLGPEEGDRAIVQGRNPLLTKPLKHGERTEIARGHLNHSDIIGSPVWGTVQTHKGTFSLLAQTLTDWESMAWKVRQF